MTKLIAYQHIRLFHERGNECKVVTLSAHSSQFLFKKETLLQQESELDLNTFFCESNQPISTNRVSNKGLYKQLLIFKNISGKNQLKKFQNSGKISF